MMVDTKKVSTIIISLHMRRESISRLDPSLRFAPLEDDKRGCFKADKIRLFSTAFKSAPSSLSEAKDLGRILIVTLKLEFILITLPTR